MKRQTLGFCLLSLIWLLANCASTSRNSAPKFNQFPAPMAEHSRTHERISPSQLPGMNLTADVLLPRPVEIFLPEKFAAADSLNLWLHFHGAAFIAKRAVYEASQPVILANIDLGQGSSTYEKPFFAPELFGQMLDSLRSLIHQRLPHLKKISGLYISSFSAGYGAVRTILRQDNYVEQITGIILLDGAHTDYIPDQKVLAEGGTLNTAKLERYVVFARLAAAGKKKFLLTHSEIFPGTYASNTETTDYVITELGLKRTPVLKWGPVGMQQISEVQAGNFYVFGFAGNSARDHVDHFHALPYFMKMLLED